MSIVDQKLRKKSVGKLRFEEGLLNNKIVSILRDSGSSVIGVRSSLIECKDKIPGSYK